MIKKIKTSISRYCFLLKLPKDIREVIFKLKPGDIVIDVGSNVGNTVDIFHLFGADVIAIEPNKYAFAILKQRFSNKSNIHLIQAAAVGESLGLVKLFLHLNHKMNPVFFSSGSSLVSTKPNVSQDYYEVTSLNLTEFIHKYQKVKIIKFDIEGFEVDLIPKLTEQNAFDNVENVFVETHNRKWLDLNVKTQNMINVAKSNKNTTFFWDWP